MRQTPDIRFIGMEPSGALASAAREKAAKLELFCADVGSCRIIIEHLHKHRRQGRPFAVRVELTFPGHELAVSRVEHEDAYVALRDAFDDMKRQLDNSLARIAAKQAEAPMSEAGLLDNGSTT